MDDDWIILGATVVSIADKSQEGSSLDKQASLAFRRSNQDVVKKAEQSGIEVVIWHNDSVVKLSPSEAASLLASRGRFRGRCKVVSRPALLRSPTVGLSERRYSSD